MALGSFVRPLLDWPALAERLAAFRRDEEGAVAVLVAAAIIPLIGALGLATDTARGYMVKARLSQALDAAALAGGKVMLSADRDADIQMFFNANFPPGFLGAVVTGPQISANADKTTLALSATAKIDTTFMSVLGIDDLTVAAETEVTRQVDQLDLVLSIDTSGSMEGERLTAAQEAAVDLVEILFGSNDESPTVDIDGTTYDLLNVGVVNWNAKVNVTIYGNTNAGAPITHSTFTSQATAGSPTNPVTGAPLTSLYYSNDSPVPLLSAPDSDWSGCVYARYTGDSDKTNDADLLRGPIENLNGNSGADWLGWEPIPTLEGEPRSGQWKSGYPDYETSSYWQGESRSCHAAYWNNDNHTIPVAVPAMPAWWYRGVPEISTNSECTVCPAVGILPLQNKKQTLIDLINSLVAQGSTNIPQGLAWAWEVLMPGQPFDEALTTVPFPRQRAIVLLTDGQTEGANGDAYKGRFGRGTVAGTNTYTSGGTGHGYLPSPPDAPNTRNNLNNRLLRLAANVKAEGIQLYVIQFANNTETLTTLLQSVATEPNAPYYFNAPTAIELQAAFNEIAANLSKLRLSR